MQNKIFLITCTDWNYSVPLSLDFAVFRLTPLSPLPFRLPWRGCWHFFGGRNLTPRTARCLGQIVKSRPSSSSNRPTRAKMSFFSDTSHDWDTFTSLRCSFMPSAHEFSGAVRAIAKRNRIPFHRRSQMNRKAETYCDFTAQMRGWKESPLDD